MRKKTKVIILGSGLVGGEGVLGVLVAGVVFWQSVKAAPGEEVRLPLEIGYQWLQLGAEAIGLTGAAVQAAPQVGAVLAFASLAALFVRCCRSR